MAGRRDRKGKRRRGGFWRGVGLFFNISLSLVLLGAAIGILYGGYRVRNAMKGMPSLAGLDHQAPGGITLVYATDRDEHGDNIVLGKVYSRFQERCGIAEVPQILRDATISIEDERFYKHPGIDVWGIGRAAVRNFQAGRWSEGASTLTQQLIKNLLLTPDKTLDRKIQEAILAVQIERTWTKDQILEKYVNEVSYGGRIYGVKAAAKYYFGKSLDKLTIAEAALIAGLPQKPPKTYPFRHPDAAIARRNIVLAKMRELGYITAEQEATEKARKVVILKEPPRMAPQFKAPHFTNWVLRNLIKRLGEETVYRGGLRIYTTLNWQMQQLAEKAVREGVREGRGDKVTQGALVSMEPNTGFIRAMVGSVDFDKSEVNYATGRAQTGSTFKPIVYTAAFETGKFDPYSTLYDGPVKIGKWSPKNYGGRYSYSSVTIKSAIASSKNTIPVRVMQEIGIDKVIECAQRMGIHSKLNRDFTLALGTGLISPLEMTDAYCVFANGGNRVDPISVWKVTDAEGNIIESTPKSVRVAAIAESAIRKIDECLQAVVEYGTASSAAGIHEIENARGKTGTTSDNKDAWFMGYTPELVTGVYVCGVRAVKKKGKIVYAYPPMEGVTGGHVCAPMWVEFMKGAVPIQRAAGLSPEPTPVPSPSGSPSPAAGPTPTSTPNPSATPAAGGGNPTLSTVGLSPGTSALAPEHGAVMPPPGAPTEPAATPEPTPSPSPRPEVIRPRPEAPRPKPTPTPEPIITVQICADSGLRANEYCPEAVPRRFLKSEAPRRVCRLHRPRPEER